MAIARWLRLSGIFTSTALIAGTAAAGPVPAKIKDAVKDANERHLPNVMAFYKTNGIEPKIDIDWSTFSTHNQVSSVVQTLHGDLGSVFRTRAGTPDGKAVLQRNVKKIVVKQSKTTTPTCSLKGGTLAFAADWSKAKIPAFDACLATGDPPPAATPASLVGAPAGEATRRLTKIIESYRNAGFEPTFAIEWASFPSREQWARMLSAIERDLVKVLTSAGATPETKATINQGVKKIAIRHVALAISNTSQPTGEATCSIQGGVLSVAAEWDQMYGTASHPPYADCVATLFPKEVKQVAAAGPVPAALKDAVARIESSSLQALKATLKEKLGVEPAYVINWATFRSAEECDAMVKYVRENVVPALETAATKPRTKALLQTVKTVAIDFDSNVGGNKCNIDRTVLTLRSNWNSFPVETRGCVRAFAMAAEPNRRVD